MQQANPFVNFIRDLAKEFPKGAVDDEAGYRQWLVDELVEHKRKFGIISLNLDSLTISEHADGASVPPEQGRTS